MQQTRQGLFASFPPQCIYPSSIHPSIRPSVRPSIYAFVLVYFSDFSKSIVTRFHAFICVILNICTYPLNRRAPSTSSSTWHFFVRPSSSECSFFFGTNKSRLTHSCLSCRAKGRQRRVFHLCNFQDFLFLLLPDKDCDYYYYENHWLIW